MNSNPTSDDEQDQWPSDLIAFKWANTLSQGEQDALLTSSVRRLQNRINSALRQREIEVREEERERAIRIVGRPEFYDHEGRIDCQGIFDAIRRDSAQEGKEPSGK